MHWLSGGFENGSGHRFTVITSYSIHYTKLYDTGHTDRPIGKNCAERFCAIPENRSQKELPPQRERLCGSAQKRRMATFFDRRKLTGWQVSGHIAPCGDRRDPILITVSHQHGERESGKHRTLIRITSYNVCYTKLLRPRVSV